VPEDARLLELGWMIEVIVTYIECRWCRKKGIYREDNIEQRVFKERKLEEAEWCECQKQKRKEEEAACPTKRKVQQGRAWAEGTAREVRRTFKILREVWMDIEIEKCYESPKKETISHAFKYFIQNLKSYNRVKE